MKGAREGEIERETKRGAERMGMVVSGQGNGAANAVQSLRGWDVRGED
jgi:hypothetical protein